MPVSILQYSTHSHTDRTMTSPTCCCRTPSAANTCTYTLFHKKFESRARWRNDVAHTCKISPSCAFHVASMRPKRRSRRDTTPVEWPSATHWPRSLTAAQRMTPAPEVRRETCGEFKVEVEMRTRNTTCRLDRRLELCCRCFYSNIQESEKRPSKLFQHYIRVV